MVLKRHKRAAVEEVQQVTLPDDVVELIMQSLPVKSVVRFKCVSSKWKSLIESPSFKQGQLLRRMLCRGPDVLFVRRPCPFAVGVVDPHSFVFGSSVAHTVNLPVTETTVCYGSCDGLLCLYNVYAPSTPNVLVNPATGWHQTFPLSPLQQLLVNLNKRKESAMVPPPELGFGKDKVSGTYKPVWLYNSHRLSSDNSLTTCQVFDFSTNAWRTLLPASPYRILAHQWPVHFDGSLYWLTDCPETKVLSFDLHTETFHVISKAPFPHELGPCSSTLCVLDNRLCVTLKNWPSQLIWSLDSSSL